ncbi:T9SS C-terminal target domain-containing protein [Candidatus Parcubacteria bacterium]|nr:MAG: T9SS C-terminal target domain-containing protein [Candidatus Parcubacteria bacterium]
MRERLLNVGLEVWLIPLLLVCLQRQVHTQTPIPNGNFEDWPACLCDPPGWTTNNVYTPFEFILVGPADPYAGNFGITGKADSSAQFGEIVAPEITSDSITVTVRPKTLSGYYKFKPNGGDKFKAAISFYKNNALIGEGMFEDSTTVVRYTQFTIDINYTSGELPDLAVVSFTIDSSEVDKRVHAGSQFWLDELAFDRVSSVSAHDDLVPQRMRLFQNYPNPFNPATTIRFAIPKRSLVTLALFDPLGRKVATLVEEELQPGEYKVRFDANGLPSGVYFYQLHAAKFVATKKLVVLR